MFEVNLTLWYIVLWKFFHSFILFGTATLKWKLNRNLTLESIFFYPQTLNKYMPLSLWFQRNSSLIGWSHSSDFLLHTSPCSLYWYYLSLVSPSWSCELINSKFCATHNRYHILAQIFSERIFIAANTFILDLH